MNAFPLIWWPVKSVVWEQRLIDTPPTTHVTAFKITQLLHWGKIEDKWENKERATQQKRRCGEMWIWNENRIRIERETVKKKIQLKWCVCVCLCVCVWLGRKLERRKYISPQFISSEPSEQSGLKSHCLLSGTHSPCPLHANSPSRQLLGWTVGAGVVTAGLVLFSGGSSPKTDHGREGKARKMHLNSPFFTQENTNRQGRRKHKQRS